MIFPKQQLSNQHGAALVISLFLLLILTLLGMSVLQTSTLEERMTANMGDMDQAFQRAESALRWTEANIDADTWFVHRYSGDPGDSAALRRSEGKANFAEDCGASGATTAGLCYDELPLQATATWESYKRTSLETANRHIVANFGLTNEPHVVIDYSCEVVAGGASECVYTYKILARGYGDDRTTQVTLEEIYRTE